MAKLTSIVALLALALLVADAHRTTITTVEMDEEDNQRGRERCSQMRAREEIGCCGQYLSQQSRYLEMRGIDNQRRRGGCSFEECCNELSRVEEDCRCELLEEIAREEQRRARGQEGRQMFQKARNLPSMCGMAPQQCYF